MPAAAATATSSGSSSSDAGMSCSIVCDDAVVLQPATSNISQAQQQPAPVSRVVAVFPGYHSDDEELPGDVHGDLPSSKSKVLTGNFGVKWHQAELDLESQQQPKQAAAAANNSSSTGSSNVASLQHAASAAWLAAHRHAAAAGRYASMLADLAAVAGAAAVHQMQAAQRKARAAARDFAQVYMSCWPHVAGVVQLSWNSIACQLCTVMHGIHHCRCRNLNNTCCCRFSQQQVLRSRKPQTACCDKSRGCILLWSLLALAALGLVLGLVLGLAYGTRRSGLRHGRSDMPWAPPGFVFTGDTQLDALLQLKAALDPTGVLDGVWERDSGRQYGFCRWVAPESRGFVHRSI